MKNFKCIPGLQADTIFLRLILSRIKQGHNYRTGSKLLLLALLISLSPAVKATDLITIDRIKCFKPASGLDVAGELAFASIGVAIATSTAIASGGTTGAIVAGSIIGGAETAFVTWGLASALDGSSCFIEDNGNGTSTIDCGVIEIGRPRDQVTVPTESIASASIHNDGAPDDLIVKINGRQVVSGSGIGTSQSMGAGDVIYPDVSVSFEQGARIQLIEYDFGSDNDDLGTIEISDKYRPGENYTVRDAIVLAPDSEDGSLYFVDYTVTRGAGDASSVTKYMLCGTNQCDACSNDNCVSQDYSSLDRDGDLEDLLDCPYPFETSSYIEYQQILFDDVYLRVCKGPVCPVINKPVPLNVTFPRDSRPLFRWTPVENAQYYEIVVRDANNSIVFFDRRFQSLYVPAEILPPGTYSFTVRGINNLVEACGSPYSDPFPVTIDPPPPPNVALAIEQLSTDQYSIGSGTINASPAPVSDIGGDFYAPGTIVTLTATPTIRSEFVSWSGSAASCDISPSCDITMADGISVQATFRPKPVLSINVSGNGNGTVTPSPAGTGCPAGTVSCNVYSTGDTVALNTRAGMFSTFDRWEGNADCLTESVTMSESKSCTAVFSKTDYQLTVRSTGGTVSSDPAGSIDCGTDCNEIYPVAGGAQTTILTASVDPGFTFVRWYGAPDCYDEDENDGNPQRISLTVGNADVSCNAMSVQTGTEYALTIEKTGAALGKVTAQAAPVVDASDIDCDFASCSQKFAVNSVIQLTATPERGSVFEGWTGHPDCEDGEVTMTNNVNCSARFTSKVLIVDGSDDDALRSQYTSVLRNVESVVFDEINSTDYDEWSVRSPSSTSNPGGRAEPVAADLAPYGSVIWYTGDASSLESFSPEAGPSPAAEADLAMYLDNGGCLLLSSPQYFLDRGVTSFAQTYLGISARTDAADETQITGTGNLNLGFGNLGSFTLKPTDEGLSTGLSDSLVPNLMAPGSETIFEYADGSTAAVATDNSTYRTAFFGFPLLALGSGSDRINVMQAYQDYCRHAEFNDAFEANNDFNSATGRQGTVTLKDLKILPGDNDYYLWESTWYADTSVSISFEHAKGDLAIELYDSTQALVDSVQSGDDNEQIIIPNVSAGQTYFVRVFGPNNATNRYSLNIMASSPPDRDHDGVDDANDAFPEDPSEQFDTDNDLIGDNLDLDDDNDGMPDGFEILFGFNPILAADAEEDADNDGFTNLRESISQTDPKNSNSVPFVIPVTVVTDDISTVVTDDDTSSSGSGGGGGSVSIWALFIMLLIRLMAGRKTSLI